MSSFWSAADAGHLPSVSFLKAPAYQDAHAANSDPLDEQHFVVNAINRLQRLPDWKSTAVVLAYDDSDGWYDHQVPPIANHSADAAQDAIAGAGSCGGTGVKGYQDRCGYGPRLPLMVISPYAKKNYVDHTVTDQTSVLRFIEDNWSLGRIGNGSLDAKAGSMQGMFDFTAKPVTKPFLLDPDTGKTAK